MLIFKVSFFLQVVEKQKPRAVTAEGLAFVLEIKTVSIYHADWESAKKKSITLKTTQR